jgi:hypothetical protein
MPDKPLLDWSVFGAGQDIRFVSLCCDGHAKASAAQIRGIGEVGHARRRFRCVWQVPARRCHTAGRGAREHAPDPADIQASGAELAVAWKGRDPFADNGRQLLMPSRRDLLCGGAFQKLFDHSPGLLPG